MTVYTNIFQTEIRSAKEQAEDTTTVFTTMGYIQWFLHVEAERLVLFTLEAISDPSDLDIEFELMLRWQHLGESARELGYYCDLNLDV